MRKIVFSVPIILLAACITFSSCSKDDENEQPIPENGNNNGGSSSSGTNTGGTNTGSGNTGGGNTGGSGGTTSSTKCERVSIEHIITAKSSKKGTRYYENGYKWTYANGRIILSMSRNEGINVLGVASKNTDNSCGGIGLSKSYRYKVTAYHTGTTDYYYFN